ncbi:DUF2149 domain-containing protein [Conexibacter sp. JD483]|uniref:DUF2149 domain-containing protein n=1 Tax=unclassified Conexibacter TaxID=2627773 RepID=UPI002721FF2A|nr:MULTISPECIES: DUF2149 domain-containing protein [unclassified Conexibacter]MDO8186867.1 DUF2149 domain-containing protein [Conexibacter sp. CPCC 205706]MDO8200821.1 DUF2149 domain-containing protein [Conexibacter sp. CPCC 205762]MDR9369957.1 DUF2149 domain-containing protein [Conexibacter sp. JD483]
MSEWGQAPAGQEQPAIRARARSREDRAGDPLDGLVNLFDLGIVLSIAFLLSSLSSLNLTDDLLKGRRDSADTAPAGSIVIRRDQSADSIEVRRGERVLGQGERVGTLYRLADGRTVLVPDSGTRTTP